MKKIVIIGGTSCIAHDCAKLWINESPKNIILVVRDESKAKRMVDDLKVRSPFSKIEIMQSSFTDPKEIERVVSKVTNQGAIDIALIAHGFLPQQIDCQSDMLLNKNVIEINGVSPVLFAESFAMAMENSGQGTIAIISSVAGDRGRKLNYVYGGAKSLVSRYAQGLQHRFFGTPIKVVLIKPGPTETPMTISFKQQGSKMSSSKEVARCIVEGIAKGRSVVYAPRKWKYIMLVIQHIPSFIFNKLNI